MGININTSLSLNPQCSHDHQHVHNIVYFKLGTTPSISFNLFDKVYTFEDLKQVTFIFKQNGVIHYYEAIIYAEDGNWELDPHFKHEIGEDYESLRFTLSSQETLQFTPSNSNKEDSLIKFEVAIELDEEICGEKAVLIENMDNIFVVDSMYKELIEV